MTDEVGADARLHVCACACPGATVRFTGLSGAAGTALAQALAEQLRACGRRVVVLGADGADDADGADGADDLQLGVVAEVLARNGVITLIPALRSGTEGCEAVRRRHEASDTAYLEVELVMGEVEACPAAVPDSHGQVTGPDLRLEVSDVVVAPAAAVYSLLAERGVLRGQPVQQAGRG